MQADQPCALCGAAPATRIRHFPVWGFRPTCAKCDPLGCAPVPPPPRAPRSPPIWLPIIFAVIALAPGVWDSIEFAMTQVAIDGDWSAFGLPGSLIFLAALGLTLAASTGRPA